MVCYVKKKKRNKDFTLDVQLHFFCLHFIVCVLVEDICFGLVEDSAVYGGKHNGPKNRTDRPNRSQSGLVSEGFRKF